MVKTSLAEPTPPEPGALPTGALALADMATRADEAAALLGALAHPKRLLVLCALLDGEQSVGRLAERAGLPQATLSQHLARMRLQGLVATRRDGTSIHYRLADPVIRDVLGVLYARFCAT